MPRVALGLAYDGSSWQGWQTQPHRQTVQDTLETALGRFAGIDAPVPTICAGRTDTGVHAAMQVVHLDTNLERRDESWVRGVNAFLPPSIAVQWAQPVSDDFHARFSARSRTYHYLLWRGRVRPPLWAGRAGWCFQALDVDAMRQAAAALLGEHDFSSFRSSQCQARHPVRTLHRLDIDERGPFLIFTLRANAFLHHMVRNLIGALLQIGQGRQPVHWMPALLAARDRRLAAPTFAPDGLYLSAIEYPAEFLLNETDGRSQLLSPFTFA
ncbi:tRNA pseudouridine(38-40) synthase TruA [Bordetella sp. BOR01]|uniref:tRNA pseudouridine(38-40) synthase TruA n=1 Tax=Bordetella sp. BOR01 TaxID=2854779 RepID=UPI001C470466|nr:tRNA pseudouridine(38-40) synthase TruA [Bordetella sp. BOR01]MBV7487054.1 tRNA pseudouridine(38-40) synthase TruA [Bordetella sp. BOR01]